MRAVDRRVFRYRRGEQILAIGFTTLWCSIWLYETISSLGNPNPYATYNGVRLSPAESRQSVELFLVIGLAVVGYVLWLFGTYVFARVEIDGSALEAFDGLNRSRLRCDLSEVKIIEEVGHGQRRRVRVGTDRGQFFFTRAIVGYAELRARLEAARAGKPYAYPLSNLGTAASSAVAAKTYRSRFSLLHLFSFGWSALCLFALVEVVPGLSGGGLIVIVFAMSLAGLILGLCLQLKGWVERIELGPDGITWIDLLGRQRVKANLSEIVAMNEAWLRRAGFFSIETTRGEIPVSSDMKDYLSLKDQIDSLLSSSR